MRRLTKTKNGDILWCVAFVIVAISFVAYIVWKVIWKGEIWVEPLATGLSLLAVGLPVWTAHWRVVQSLARREDDSGREERASLPRRAYLYGVALAGALLILYYLAQVVYRVLLWLLGDPDAQLLSGETVDDVARSAIAALLWAVHVLAIRTDLRMGADRPVPEPRSDGQEATRRSVLEERIRQLESRAMTKLRGDFESDVERLLGA